MVNHGYPWLTMHSHGSPWISIVDHGYPWSIIDIHGSPWISMSNHGYPWLTMDIHGWPWTSMVNHRYDGSGDRNHCHSMDSLEILELIRDPRIPGFRRLPGNVVRSRKPDTPKHAQESSDDVSFQQTPQMKLRSSFIRAFGGLWMFSIDFDLHFLGSF